MTTKLSPLQVLGIWPRSPDLQQEHERIPYPLMRGSRLRTSRDIGETLAHNLRAIDVPNADPARPIEIRIGAHTVAGVKRQIAKRLKQLRPLVRGRPIRALHFVCAMPNRAWYERQVKADPERVEALQRQMEAWVKRQFGDAQVASLVWHYDEETPHLHALVLPLEQRIDTGGRPSKISGEAKEPRVRWTYVGSSWFGPREDTKAVLSLRQDEFFDDVKDWGLVRGERGSTARHMGGPARMDLLRQADDQLKAAQRRQADIEAAWARDVDANRAAIIAAASEAADKIKAEARAEAERHRAGAEAAIEAEVKRRTAVERQRLLDEAVRRKAKAEAADAKARRVIEQAERQAQAIRESAESTELLRDSYNAGARAFIELIRELRDHKAEMEQAMRDAVSKLAEDGRQRVRAVREAEERQRRHVENLRQERRLFEAQRAAYLKRNAEWAYEPKRS